MYSNISPRLWEATPACAGWCEPSGSTPRRYPPTPRVRGGLVVLERRYLRLHPNPPRARGLSAGAAETQPPVPQPPACEGLMATPACAGWCEASGSTPRRSPRPPQALPGAGSSGSPCVPSLVLGFRTPRLPLLPLWEKGDAYRGGFFWEALAFLFSFWASGRPDSPFSPCGRRRESGG